LKKAYRQETRESFRLPAASGQQGDLELRIGEGECIIWGMKGPVDGTYFFDGINRIFNHSPTETKG
jgi:hypothetical protein